MIERNRVENVALRALAAAVVGSAVAGTSYLCAYYSQRGFWHDHHDPAGGLYAQTHLDHLEEAVEKHRRVTGRLPANLAELEIVGAKGHHRFQADDAGRVLDEWGYPYQYRVEGNGYTLYSLGRDGRPGGDGHDADLYPSSAGRPPELPTLRQFTFDLPTEGVRWTCVLTGACAGLVCLLPSRNRRGERFLVRAGATAVGAVLVAVVISFLHLPLSGH